MTVSKKNLTKNKSTRSGRSQRGIALVIVLWVVAAAALFVSAFNATVRSGMAFVASEVGLSEAQALVDAGLEIAAARLIDAVESRRWRAGGKVHRVSFLNQELSVRIEDPNGRIDINKTSGRVLLSFFEKFLRSDEEAKRLCLLILKARATKSVETCDQKDQKATADDKRGASQAARTKIADAVTSGTSQDATAPTAIRSPKFLDVTQLRDFPEFDTALYKQVEPYLTVYSRDGRINPLTASEKVLSAVPNITPSDIDSLHAVKLDDPRNKSAVSEIMQRAGAYLTEKEGPAYIINVTKTKPGGRNASGRQFVIVIGLDDKAPYRLVASRFIAPRN